MLVKKYPNGPMSTHLHDLNVGQSLSIRGPIPKYKWEENKYPLPLGSEEELTKDTRQLA